MAIRTNSGGVVITKNGLVSCQCCNGGEVPGGEFDVVFGAIGACDCSATTFPNAVYCYQDLSLGPGVDLSRQLSPASITVNGITYQNETPNTTRFTLPPIFLQGPTFDELGNINGFINRVSQPSVVNIFGSVGGDVAVSDRAPAGQPSGPDYVPDEGEFPCGICDTPRNGPHVLNINAVMYPNVLFYVVPFTYLRCFPHLRLRVTIVGPYTPP
jgi:hypothetical protein